jgi:GH24 family phage-related lysozyme (muramidase)
MVIQVNLPNGSVANFPDGTNKEIIASALRKNFGNLKKTSSDALSAKQPLGFVDSVGLGFRKGGVGLIQGATDIYGALGGEVSPDFEKATYEAAQSLNEQGKGSGFTGFLGEVIGQAAALPIPALKAATIPRMIAAGGAQGAALGAVAPLEEGQSRALSVLGGGAIGSVANPLLPYAVAPIGKVADYAFNSATNAKNIISDLGRKVATNINVNIPSDVQAQKQAIAELGKDAIKYYKQAINTGLAPREAYIAAKSKDNGINLTRGDLSQDPATQVLEDQAGRGILGEAAKEIANNNQKSNQAAMQNYLQDIAEEATGAPFGTMRFDDTSTGASVAFSVKDAAAKQKTEAVDFLEKGKLGKAFAPLENAATIHKNIRANLSKDFPLENMPNVQSRLKDLRIYDDLEARRSSPKNIEIADNNPAYLGVGGRTITKQIEPPKVKVQYKRLDALRQKIGNTPASTPQEQAALSRMYSLYTGELHNMLDNGILTGDVDAIKALKQGHKLYAGYMQRWFGKDGKSALGNIVKKDLTDREVGNLFGSSVWGAKNSVRVVRQLKANLGEESEAMAQVRGMFLNRILNNNLSKETPNFGTGFKATIEHFKRKDTALYDELFSSPMQKELEDFANISWQMNNKVKSKVNPSGSGAYIAQLQSNILGKIPWLGEAAQAINVAIKNGSKEQRTINSFLDPLKRAGADSKIISIALRNMSENAAPHVTQKTLISSPPQSPFAQNVNVNIPPAKTTLEITPQSYDTQMQSGLPSTSSNQDFTQINEGQRLSTYNDTEGNPTIGYGFNFKSGIAPKIWKQAGVQTSFKDAYLGKAAITPDEAVQLYQTSKRVADDDARAVYGDAFDAMSESGRTALSDLAYHHGKPSLQRNLNVFNKHIKAGNLNSAVRSLQGSQYAVKYPERAQKVIQLLLQGN